MGFKKILQTTLALLLSLFISNCSYEPIPFTAEFSTSGGVQMDLQPDEVAAICGDGPFMLNIQTGVGSATELGEISYYASFCVDVSTFQSGQIKYFSTDQNEAYLVSAVGDTLFLPLQSGIIVPTEENGYDMEFEDQFTATKGTGKLDNILLEVSTNSLVIMNPERTDHTWTGTIKLN